MGASWCIVVDAWRLRATPMVPSWCFHDVFIVYRWLSPWWMFGPWWLHGELHGPTMPPWWLNGGSMDSQW